VVKAWLVDEPSQSQGWRVLPELLAAIYPAGVQVWSFSLLLALIHATEGILWFLLLTNATEFFSSWLKRRRVVMLLDSAMGAILIAFGLKLAFDKAR
jgi:threonine/homoserine/homoserine lactone efflux protein